MLDLSGRSQRRFAYLMTLPVVVFLFCLLIFPTLFLFLMSLQSSDAGLSETQFVAFANYAEVLTNPIVHFSIQNTLVYVTASVALSLGIGMAVALLLNSIDFGSSIFQTLFVLPLAVAPVISGLTWSMALNPDLGVINYLLGSLGLLTPGWATDTSTALITVVLIDVWYWTPFTFLIFYAGLKMLPLDVYEAAVIDGASWLQQTRFLTIPLLKPVILIALLFRTMDAIRAFDIIFTVTEGGPGRATENLVLRSFFEGLKFFNPEISATIGVMLLIITWVATKALLRYLPKDA